MTFVMVEEGIVCSVVGFVFLFVGDFLARGLLFSASTFLVVELVVFERGEVSGLGAVFFVLAPTDLK